MTPRVASFEDITRHPQNDRTRWLGRIASTLHPQPGTGRPRVRQHAAARGVLRSRVRQSAASRDRRGRPGPPPFMPRGKTHSCYRSRGGGRRVTRGCGVLTGLSLHDAPPTAPVHPPATCGGGTRADRCSRCFPVGYVTVCNSLVVLTNTERQGRYRKRRKGWRVPVPPASDRRSASHHDGTGRPPARVRVGHATTWSVAGRVRPAVHAGPKVGVGVVWVEQHGRPSPVVGRHRLPEVPALATPCAPRGAKPAASSPPLDADSTGSHPVRQPESGGLPRPLGVVDGRDAPSRPGRKAHAHNCHLSRGSDGVSPAGP